MIKETARKLLAFLIFYTSALPWTASICLPYLGMGSFVLVHLCWLVILCGTAASSLWFKAAGKGRRILFSVIAATTSVLLPYLFVKGSSGVFFVYTVLGAASLAVWIISFKLAYSFEEVKRLVNAKSLTAGLAGIVVFSMVFPQPSTIIYGYFLAYILFSSLWMLKWDSANAKGSFMILGSFFAFTFFFGIMRNTILYCLWWIYRYVVANILLLFLAPLGLQSLDLPSLDFMEGSTGEDEGESEPENSLEKELEGLQGEGRDFSIWDKLWPYLKWMLIILAVFLVVYAVYRILSRYVVKGGSQSSKKETKERILPEESLGESFTKRTARILKAVKGMVLPKTLEGKVRRMYRDVVHRMVQRMMPISRGTTPFEAMETLPREEELFYVYNDVRYGEKRITRDEFIKAEESYDNICRQIAKSKKP